ncbi:MAG: DUF72 domain-containing protein [Saprospiraceae bacterium]
MKFGKLQDISNVDFALPSSHFDNEKILTALPKRTQKPLVFVGCTGWSMKEWVGRVYPKGTKSADYLRHYAKQFNTIELNTTHYRIPNEATILKWKSTAPADFQFCPKIPQSISHSRDLGRSDENLLRFCNSINGLEAQLGCSFMQLPPYFGYERLPILENFFKRFPTHIPLAVEVRHESWFDNIAHLDALTALCQQYNIAIVMTDVAGRRDVLHQRLTNDTAMIRFVGNGLHATDYERIDAWIKRLMEWFAQGLHQVYFFPHEPDNLLAPEMVEYFVEKMAVHDVIIRGPKLKDENEGSQISLF